VQHLWKSYGVKINSIDTDIKKTFKRRVYEQTYIRLLFDSIAYRYDFLNHILSLGIDIVWRQRAIRLLKQFQPKRILDVATGTADLAIAAAQLCPDQIIGIDISPKMLEQGRQKINEKKLEHIIVLEIGNAEHLNFETGFFDIVMAAFGVRNFENLELGLKEFHRVLRDGGIVMVLEFSKPRRFPVKQIFLFYSKYFLPILGGLISKNREAYKYLPNTVAEFPDGDEFCAMLCSAGFISTKHYPQTFGIASIYIARKVNY
jgi:demethylmenaquinone methyltransferase/2-methoxy-6-polyprenyl-1,4-benzoquinol methylase